MKRHPDRGPKRRLSAMALSCCALAIASPAMPADTVQLPMQRVLMTYWSDNTARFANYPIPGSRAPTGTQQQNPELRQQLAAVNVLAYAFLQVGSAGEVYFERPSVDLSLSDVQQFCQQQPMACPNSRAASAGSFSAFARLNNPSRTLRRIISVGGAGSQSSLMNALHHPEEFVRTAVSIIHAFNLDGIDLDFEPDSFFGPGQGERYAQIIKTLRSALGGRAFISVELPGDWETLRSIDCPADTRCRDNLALLASYAYVSLMGYDFHGPDYPGSVTGNDSNLYSDPEEPLLPGFYHASDSQAVEYLTFRGVLPGKILLGFPAYFVAYGGVAAGPVMTGLYQPFDRARTATYDLGLKAVGSDRFLQQLLKSGFTQHALNIDGKLSAVYAYNPSLKQWMSYDDPDSIAAKAKYVVARRLGGMMMGDRRGHSREQPTVSPAKRLPSTFRSKVSECLYWSAASINPAATTFGPSV